jgi:hypothetical protein
VSAQEKHTPSNLYVRKQGNGAFKDRLHPCDERDLHAAVDALRAGDPTKTKLPDQWKAPYFAEGWCGEGRDCHACARVLGPIRRRNRASKVGLDVVLFKFRQRVP